MESFKKEQKTSLSVKYEADENGFVQFGDVSREELGKQAQYGSRYVNGFSGEYPNLGVGLRFEGDPIDYHSLKIHVDDIAEFVKRFSESQ